MIRNRINRIERLQENLRWWVAGAGERPRIDAASRVTSCPYAPHRLYLFDPARHALTWLPDPTRIDRSTTACSALVWQMGHGVPSGVLHAVSHRPPETPLILILPPPPALATVRLAALRQVVQETRPIFIVPGDVEVTPVMLSEYLMEPPGNLTFDMVEFLMWIDPQMRRIIQDFQNRAAEVLTPRGVVWFLRTSGTRMERELDRNGICAGDEPACLGEVLEFLTNARGVASSRTWSATS